MLEQTNFEAGGRLFEELISCSGGKIKSLLPQGAQLRILLQVFGDSDLVNTCLCLFENDLNVSRAAAALYMHRNTLIYRIAKIKRLTGLDVRTFSDAVTFLILYRAYLWDGSKQV